MSDFESNVNPKSRGFGTRPDGEIALEHATVENADGERECTVFPRDCNDEEIVTHWITAHERSFVALDEMR